MSAALTRVNLRKHPRTCATPKKRKKRSWLIEAFVGCLVMAVIVTASTLSAHYFPAIAAAGQVAANACTP